MPVTSVSPWRWCGGEERGGLGANVDSICLSLGVFLLMHLHPYRR